MNISEDQLYEDMMKSGEVVLEMCSVLERLKIEISNAIKYGIVRLI